MDKNQWIDWTGTEDLSIKQDDIVVNATTVDYKHYNDYFPDPFRFSKCNRLLNATCYVKKSINVIINKDVITGPISIGEQSKKLLINEIKLKLYHDEDAVPLWRKEYILALKERDRKVKPINVDGAIIPSVGDVVNIIDDTDPNI